MHEPTATIETLRKRAEIVSRIREFFTADGFLEVETPLLCRESVIDAHLDPFAVPVPVGSRTAETWYLQTSPEFCMKRLLAAGAEKIFQIAHAFRREESGAKHNPEFTLLEWYEVGTSKFDQMDRIESLCRRVLTEATAVALPETQFARITYQLAFQEACQFDVLAAETAELRSATERLLPDQVTTSEHATEIDADLLRQLLLTECVEPWLARQGAIFLYDYPMAEAALARISPDDHRVAERFELYLDGIEICNGYRELLDASELERRNIEQNRIRKAQGLSELPRPERLLTAMHQGLPDCSGVALGLDRLVMLALGKTTLAEVIAFPFDRV